MEVVPALSDSSPFQRRDVAEWSHMDRLTGMMETARVETDRWAASTSTSAHSYGKVVDSRNRSLPDGSAQQRQRQQLEVFQTKGPGGSLQVIRTQSVTSTNSSWRGTSLVGSRAPLPAITQDFGNLQLTLNPLDISSEKSKGSVGRSGSIGGRRPPSRPRSIVGKVVVPLAIEEDAVSSRLSQVSRICQQVHDEKKKTAFTANDRALKNISSLRELTSSTSSRSSISEITNGHSSIIRKKSSSIEDLHNDGSEEHDDKDEVLTRSAKVRRSLQFPLKKLEARGGVSKLLQDLEDSNNKRNTPEGRIARKSFEALENVLKRGNSIVDSIHKSETEDSESILTGSETSGEYSNKHTVNNINLDSFSRRFSDANKISIEKRHSYIDALDSREEQDSSTDEGKNKSPATKRHSFVTVESLKEVRGRLKRLNSPLDGLDTESGMEEADDGIEAEESTKTLKEVVSEVPQSRVKSYVYGMEAMSQNGRQPVAGTGSLESRTSKNSSNSSRSDEWYNRRKSYGFEQVTGAQRNDSSSTLSSKGDESKLESTDSGICRSSEMFNVPSWNRKLPSNMLWNKSGETDVLNVSHSIHIKRDKGEENVNGDENNEGVQRRRSTIVNFDSKSEQRKDEAQSNKVTDVLRRSSGSGKMLSALLVNGVRSDDSDESGRQQYVTVSIPIVHDDSSPTVGSRRLFYQQLTQGTTLSVDKSLKKSTKTIDDQSPSYNGSRVLGDDWWMKPNRGSNVYSDDSKLGNEDWRTPSKLSSALKRHSFAEGKSWKNLNGNENVHEGIESESRVGGSEDWHRPSQLVDSGMKRHSIAVDELKYVKENKPVAGFSVTFAQQSREDTDNLILKKHKKVEFCKTEVHFAAEPGRINIVETDEKPPSTNMFRRRRRNSNPTPDAPKTSNLPEVRFGDSIYEKQLLGGNEEIQDVVKSTRPTTLRLNRQEDTFQDKEDQVYTQANATIRAHHTEEEGDEIDENNDYESSHVSKPRSILKSYTKPLLYHLGDEDSTSSPVEDEQEKWGVRLRPVVQERSPVWKSTVTLSSRDDVMPVEYSGQSELQKLLRSLRPANQNKQEQIVVARHSGSVKSSEKLADWSVAERIRHVEQVASESKGFSTRVNFGGGEATVVDDEQSSTNGGQNQRLFQISDRPKPVWQRREEALISSGYSVCAPSEEGHDPQRTHSSVATAVLPNYGDAGRLRAVETLVSTRSGHPKITSISLRYDEEQNNTARHSASDAFKFTSRTSISPERRNSSYNETETAFISKDNPTYLEPSYRSKQPLFSQIVTKPNENNSTNSSSKSETYSIKSQYKNTRERKTFTDKNESEDMTNYIPERQMLPPAKLTVISAESPATTITSKVSAFEKQHVSTRSSQSSPAARTTTHSPSTVALNFDPISSHSSSRIVSSFESKMSNSSNSRRSQSPVITDHSYQHISQRYSSSPSNQPSPKPEDKQDKTFTGFDSPTVALELKQTQDTSPSRYISRDRKATESHQVDVKSKLTSSQVECELGTVTKAMSRSPSPTKKVTSPSKNSINKDFIGRVRSESPIYQNKERSSNQNKMIPSKTSLKDITEKSVKSGSQSPIYQNKEVYTSERNRKSSRSNHPVVEPETRLTECGLDAVETDSAILEELTRAADQILQAVNGYTDEESRRASSDDEEHSRKTTEGRVLGTIAEKPSSQKHTDGKKESIKMNGNVRKIQRTVSKTKLGPTSSTSSVESLSRESRRALLKSEKASSSTTSRSATSSRTARMVQRASSRELLLQAHASSSEDVASGTDTKKPRAPPPRRTRTSSSHTNKVSTSSASKSREKQPSEAKEPARSTRERISVSKVKSRDTTTSSLDSSRKTPLTKQYPVKEKNIPGVCNSTPGRDRSSSSRTTTTTRTKKSVSASRHEGASTSSKVTK